jgi:hypothetical protein
MRNEPSAISAIPFGTIARPADRMREIAPSGRMTATPPLPVASEQKTVPLSCASTHSGRFRPSPKDSSATLKLLR